MKNRKLKKDFKIKTKKNASFFWICTKKGPRELGPVLKYKTQMKSSVSELPF